MKFWVGFMLIVLFGVSSGFYTEKNENLTTDIQITDDVVNKVNLKDIFLVRNINIEGRLTTRNSSSDFPNIIQSETASVIIAFVVGIYCFTFLALLCDGYFLPSVESLCVILSISEDVAAATFMSMATSAPEFFVNIVSTFISESDLGLGTIVGSSSFNTLFTPALGCLAVTQPLQLDWWPVTRDSSFYLLSISLLVVVVWDGKVYWYEALILFIFYILYFIYIFLSTKVASSIKRFVHNNSFLSKVYSITPDNISEKEVTSVRNSKLNSSEKKSEKIIQNSNSKNVYVIEDSVNSSAERKSTSTCNSEKVDEKDEKEKDKNSLFKFPKGGIVTKFFFVYTWPLRFLLKCVMPNHVKYPRLTPITFLICVGLIGVNSYIISWMVTNIGNTFHISDTVMGFTLSAGGGALPEAFSLVIKVRKGEGAMGVSNSLGANTMNILLSLGLPWLISTLSNGANLSSFVELQSGNIHYTILGLIVVVFSLYTVLLTNKFKLSRPSGIILMVVWLIFLSLAITLEIRF